MAATDQMKKRLQELTGMPAGVDRIKAALRIGNDAADKAKPAREQLAKAAWVLAYRHGWSKTKAAKDTGLFTTSIFPAAALVEPSEKEILAALPDWDEDTAVAERTTAAKVFSACRAVEDGAREVRRHDVAALYQGQFDGRLWEIADIGTEYGMDTTMVKADLKAAGVELRPSQRRKVASPEGGPENLGAIARMLGISRLYLKDRITYWRNPSRADNAKAFPPDAAAEGGKYWPNKVAAWFRSLPTVAASPTGLTLRRAADRVGEPYDTVKSAIDQAADDGTLPAGLVYSNGAVHEGHFVQWWRTRKERLHAGVPLSDVADELGVDYKAFRMKVRAAEDAVELPAEARRGDRYDRDGLVAWWRSASSSEDEGVMMKTLAEQLGVKPEQVRYQVRKAEQAGGLPAGVRLESGRFDLEAARRWWRGLGL
ncbi:hypothetical protein [Nonomuraea glycinis]|uniref:hypothetical protein n=1 Tax=Nonomuraea glycinis TaxID=2047744 RepID=UPI0033A3B17D